MAAIDKIYGNKSQYDQFFHWCKRKNPKALMYFYVWDYPDDGKNYAITNFPEHIDRWMLENCDLQWVTDYIRDQYGLDNLYDYMTFLGHKDQ